MDTIQKLQKWFTNLPDKKRYLELISAFLTIPVLLTVVITNYNNISKNEGKPSENNSRENSIKEKEFSATPQEKTAPTLTPFVTSNSTPTLAPVTECKKGIGHIEIVSPQENEVLSKNPVCLEIAYQKEDYCSVVWSYRINNQEWSEYTDRSICIYDMPSSEKKLELKVKGVNSDAQVILKRTFTYQYFPTPTDKISSDSASLRQ